MTLPERGRYSFTVTYTIDVFDPIAAKREALERTRFAPLPEGLELEAILQTLVLRPVTEQLMQALSEGVRDTGVRSSSIGLAIVASGGYEVEKLSDEVRDY